MIVVLKHNVPEEKRNQLINWLRSQRIDVHPSLGEYQTVLGLVGDTSRIDMSLLESLDIVDSVKRVSDPFKCCNRKFHPDDTVVSVGDAKFGGGHFAMIAGPCSVESEEQIVYVAKAVAKQETGLPIVTELMNIKHLPLFENVDVIQIGARNMQNYDLLKEMGSVKKPILLKRGLANTLKELLMSAEYIMASGNDNVILCERGIRTFDDYTRNTLDLAAVPMLHELSHLPVIVDPSHSTGINRLVPPMTLAAAACGADGVIVEVHNDPIHALCDGAQSLTCEQFAEVARKVRAVREAVAE